MLYCKRKLMYFKNPQSIAAQLFQKISGVPSGTPLSGGDTQTRTGGGAFAEIIHLFSINCTAVVLLIFVFLVHHLYTIVVENFENGVQRK